MVRRVIIFFIVLGMAAGHTVRSQTVIKGRITDRQTGNALEQVIITSQGGQAITDPFGNFTLGVDEKDTTLHIHRLGYKSLAVSITDLNSPFRFSLDPDPVQLNQIVVSADHVQRNYQEYPGSLGLLLRKDLQRDQDITLLNSLNRVPGVYMQSGALNTNRITIRGLGSRSPFSTNRVKAYFDEIPLTMGDGETAIEDIDLTFLERVEVIKGPNASLYGAGLGGTIRLMPGNMTHGNHYRVSQSLGSYGLSRQTFSMKSGNQQRDLMLGFTHTTSDGYRQNNDYQRINALASGTLRLDKGRLRLLGQAIQLDAQIPSSINDSTFAADPEAAAPNWLSVQGFEDYQKYLIGLSYQWNTHNVSGTTALFANLQRQDERRPFNVLEDTRDALGIRTVWKGSIGRKSFWAAGTELFFERYDWQTFETLTEGKGERLSDNTENRWYQNIFAQWERSLGKRWHTVLGFNLNLTRFELDDNFVANGDLSGDRSFDPVLSPRFALNYAASDHLNFYGSINHGFSTPSLEETLAPDGEINPDIQPESGWNFELGSKGSVLSGLRYQVAVYHMPVSDLLVPRRTAEDAFVGINAGRTIHNGIEIDLQKDWRSASGNTLSLFLNYLESFYSFDKFETEDENFNGNQLTGTPDRTLSGGIDMSLSKGLSVYLNVQYTGEMPIDDGNTLFTDDYLVSNVKLDQTFSFGKWNMVLFMGVNNFLDEKYASMIQINARGFGGRAPRYFYPGLPRNYFGGVSLSFDQ